MAFNNRVDCFSNASSACLFVGTQFAFISVYFADWKHFFCLSERRHKVILKYLHTLQILYLQVVFVNTKYLTSVLLKLTSGLADLVHS